MIVRGVRLNDTGNVNPSFLAIEKLYAMFCDATFVDRPNELMYFSASVSLALNGVYPKAVVTTAGLIAIDTGNVVPSFLAIEKLYATFNELYEVAAP